jgi:CBS domain containing-hemolysin-like protein
MPICRRASSGSRWRRWAWGRSEEQRLSEAALVFGDTRAREVMKPRAEVDFVLATDSARTVAHRAIATGRTRFPLCEPDGGLESALGAINAKDLLPLIFEDARSAWSSRG